MYSDEMSKEDITIVAGWKNAVRGTFVVDRHLRKGSILVSLDMDKKVYLVRGIYSSWREMLGDLPMPQMVAVNLRLVLGETIIALVGGIFSVIYGVCLKRMGATEEAKKALQIIEAADDSQNKEKY